MPKSAADNRPPGPLLQVVWVTKNGGRTRAYKITIGSSAIALAIILIGSHTWALQEVAKAVVRIAALH